jgi:hypothetical protein
VRDQFGFIDCADRDAKLFFHFSEYPAGSNPKRDDEVRVALPSPSFHRACSCSL